MGKGGGRQKSQSTIINGNDKKDKKILKNTVGVESQSTDDNAMSQNNAATSAATPDVGKTADSNRLRENAGENTDPKGANETENNVDRTTSEVVEDLSKYTGDKGLQKPKVRPVTIQDNPLDLETISINVSNEFKLNSKIYFINRNAVPKTNFEIFDLGEELPPIVLISHNKVEQGLTYERNLNQLIWIFKAYNSCKGAFLKERLSIQTQYTTISTYFETNNAMDLVKLMPTTKHIDSTIKAFTSHTLFTDTEVPPVSSVYDANAATLDKSKANGSINSHAVRNNTVLYKPANANNITQHVSVRSKIQSLITTPYCALIIAAAQNDYLVDLVDTYTVKKYMESYMCRFTVRSYPSILEPAHMVHIKSMNPVLIGFLFRYDKKLSEFMKNHIISDLTAKLNVKIALTAEMLREEIKKASLSTSRSSPLKDVLSNIFSQNNMNSFFRYVAVLRMFGAGYRLSINVPTTPNLLHAMRSLIILALVPSYIMTEQTILALKNMVAYVFFGNILKDYLLTNKRLINRDLLWEISRWILIEYGYFPSLNVFASLNTKLGKNSVACIVHENERKFYRRLTGLQLYDNIVPDSKWWKDTMRQASDIKMRHFNDILREQWEDEGYTPVDEQSALHDAFLQRVQEYGTMNEAFAQTGAYSQALLDIMETLPDEIAQGVVYADSVNTGREVKDPWRYTYVDNIMSLHLLAIVSELSMLNKLAVQRTGTQLQDWRFSDTEANLMFTIFSQIKLNEYHETIEELADYVSLYAGSHNLDQNWHNFGSLAMAAELHLYWGVFSPDKDRVIIEEFELSSLSDTLASIELNRLDLFKSPLDLFEKFIPTVRRLQKDTDTYMAFNVAYTNIIRDLETDIGFSLSRSDKLKHRRELLKDLVSSDFLDYMDLKIGLPFKHVVSVMTNSFHFLFTNEANKDLLFNKHSTSTKCIQKVASDAFETVNGVRRINDINPVPNDTISDLKYLRRNVLSGLDASNTLVSLQKPIKVNYPVSFKLGKTPKNDVLIVAHEDFFKLTTSVFKNPELTISKLTTSELLMKIEDLLATWKVNYDYSHSTLSTINNPYFVGLKISAFSDDDVTEDVVLRF